MDRISVRLLGDKELRAVLAGLGGPKLKSALRKALRAGGKIVLALAKSRVPRDTGALARGLRLRALKRSRVRLGVRVMTPPREKLKIDPDAKGYYPAHVELGHKKPDGTQVPAQPFLRNAHDQSEGRVVATVRSELARLLAQAWREKRRR